MNYLPFIATGGLRGGRRADEQLTAPQIGAAIASVPTIQRRPWVVADGEGGASIEVRPIIRLAVAVKDRLEAWGPEAYA